MSANGAWEIIAEAHSLAVGGRNAEGHRGSTWLGVRHFQTAGPNVPFLEYVQCPQMALLGRHSVWMCLGGANCRRSSATWAIQQSDRLGAKAKR